MANGPTEMMRRARANRGFTLIEVMVSISILAIIVGIVYASLQSVIDATELARASTEEMRVRQFLARSFSDNIGSVYIDTLYINEQFHFLGSKGGGLGSGMSTLEFCSSAPLIGGLAPPGILKRVTYSASTNFSASSSFLDADSNSDAMTGPPAATQLQAVETPIADASLGLDTDKSTPDRKLSFGNDDKKSGSFLSDDTKSPSWNIPIENFRITYFDGAQWVEDWDSDALQRLPWAVRMQVNFPKTSEARQNSSFSSDGSDVADFDMIIPIVMAQGTMSQAQDWWMYLAPSMAAAMAGGSGAPMTAPGTGVTPGTNTTPQSNNPFGFSQPGNASGGSSFGGGGKF